MILDTDFIIAIIRKDESAITFIENNLENQVKFFITQVNLWELYQGVYKFEKIQENLLEVNELIRHFKIIDFSKETAIRFGRLINVLRKKVKQIGVMDTLIASIALENNLKIVTKKVNILSLLELLLNPGNEFLTYFNLYRINYYFYSPLIEFIYEFSIPRSVYCIFIYTELSQIWKVINFFTKK